MTTAILIIVVLVMIVGAFGTILPAIPGAPLIFAAALIYGIYEGFHKVTIVSLVVLGVITLITILIDYLASMVGAKKYGASKYGVWGAIIGGILGIPLGIIGLFIGPFIGAVVGEIITGKELKQSFRIGFGSLIGIIGGSLIKFAFSTAMIIYFLYLVLK